MEPTPIPSLNTDRAWAVADALVEGAVHAHGVPSLSADYLAENLHLAGIGVEAIDSEAPEVLAWLAYMAEAVLGEA